MAEYIEREAVLGEIAKMTIRSEDIYDYGIMAGVYAVKKKVAETPAADVAPVVHGRWEAIYYTRIHNGATSFEGFMCSVCKKMKSSKFDFCPNCGARMDGDG